MELILITLTFLLALYELVGIVRAKRLGLTTNTFRLITHSLIIILILSSMVQILQMERKILGSQSLNIPLLVLWGITAFISGIEALKVYRARQEGLTDNISRIVTHSAIFIMMVGIISMNL